MSQNHQDPPDILVQRLVPYDEQDDIERRSQSSDTPAPPVDNMIKIIKANKPSAASHLKKPLTSQNWPDWSIWMIGMLRTFQVWPYITSKITRPAVNLQSLKKLSQCLAIFQRLSCRKSNKLHNNLKITYTILRHLDFRISFISCDLVYN